MPTYSEYRMQEQRALAEGTAGAGGYLVPDQYARTWFEMLRARSVVLSANPVLVEATSDTVRLPKVATGTVVGMYAENTTIAQGDPTFGEVTLTPRKAAALTLVSSEIVDDSAPSVREVLARDHIAQLGVYLDSQFLGVAGNGTAPNMRGLRNFTGANVTSIAASLTLDHVAQALERLEAANAGARPAIYLHSRDFGTLRRQKDAQNRYQLNPDPSEAPRPRLFGIDLFVSNQIPTNLGAGTNESWIVVADMDQVAVAQRKTITVEYSRDFAFSSDQVAVRTLARYDIAPINVAGVEILSAVRP
jgi:HK97 family phage major capsid protein